MGSFLFVQICKQKAKMYCCCIGKNLNWRLIFWFLYGLYILCNY